METVKVQETGGSANSVPKGDTCPHNAAAATGVPNTTLRRAEVLAKASIEHNLASRHAQARLYANTGTAVAHRRQPVHARTVRPVPQR